MADKHITLTLVVAMWLTVLTAHAQDDATPPVVSPRHMIQLSVGTPSIIMGYRQIDPWLTKGLAPRNYATAPSSWFGTQSDMKSATFMPQFTVSYWYALKPWLLLGGEASLGGWHEKYLHTTDLTSAGTARVMAIYIMPSIRFHYIHRPVIGLYSGVAAGVNANIVLPGHATYNSIRTVKSAFQLTFVGLRVGRRIYGAFELGLGVKGVLNAGIGLRL